MQPLNDSTEVVHVLIDVNDSIVNWKGTEMWGTGSHEGILKFSEGSLVFEKGQLSGGYFTADMHSITVTDIPKSDPIPRKNLTEHLKSEDFFDIEQYPTAKFNITKVKVVNANSFKVRGDLSIRDVSRSISFIATKATVQDSFLVMNATIKIDRFEYNISYQGNYWDRLTSILDNALVDANIYLSIKLIASLNK